MHALMAKRRTECQQLGMRLGLHVNIFVFCVIASIALSSAACAVEAASHTFPFLTQLASTLTLIAGWPVTFFLFMFFKDFAREYLPARRARRLFFAAAAERRAANAARRGAARSTGQPRSAA